MALENLPFQSRLVVLLHDIDGFSSNEIETITCSPRKSIVSDLYRGRRQLQVILWNYIESNGYLSGLTSTYIS